MNANRPLATVSLWTLSIALAGLGAVPSQAQTVTKLNNVTNTIHDTTTSSTDGRLGLGSSGKGDDAHLYLSNVLKDDDGTYKTWYGGHDGGSVRIYYATSPDGLTWTKYTNAIPTPSNTGGTLGRLPLGTGAGRGDVTHAYGAWVIKDDGIYKMWYGGGDGIYRIYHATSPDGLTWTKYQNATPTNSNWNCTEGRIACGTNSGDSGGANWPCVIKDGSEYKIWYSGCASDGKWRVFYATSSNGLDWVKLDNSTPTASNAGGSNGRIPVGTSGGDTGHAFVPSVVRTATGYRMWYNGYDGATYRIYHATSSNGLDWVKVNNAVPTPATNTTTSAGRIALGTTGRGDATHIYRAVPLLETGMPYRLWYMGSDGAWRTYYATMERDRPAVTNLPAINVGTTTADLPGALLQNESDPAARIFVFWGLTNGGTNAASWATNADWGVMSPGAFTNTISGLSGSSTYYYRFCATNALGEGWASNSLSFATLGGPLVSMTNGPTGITGVCATVSGLILGGKPDPDVYACWGSTDGGQGSTGDWQYVQALGAKSNAFALTVTNLWMASQTNYYAFFATNQYGSVWAGVSNFVSDQTTIMVSNNVTAERGNGTNASAVFGVTLQRPSMVDVSFSYTTADGTATSVVDYVATNGSILIPAGSTVTAMTVIVKGDSVAEANGETYTLNFSSVTNAYIAAQAFGLIIDPTGAYAAQWDGGGVDDNWSTAANWFYDRAPTNPTVEVIRFTQLDNGGRNILDPENLTDPSNTWRVGSLQIINTGTPTDFTHLHDLNGKTQAIEGDLQVAWGSANSTWARAVFTNGTLRIGTPSAKRNLSIGTGGSANMGELKIAPGATLDANLATLTIGANLGGGGTLDLRGATVAGGVLSMTDLIMCQAGNGGVAARNMYILLDSTTGLNEFRVTRNFDYAYHQQYHCRIGDPADGYKLPPGLSFTIGSPGSRGRLWIATNPYGGGTTAYLIASSNGQFVAYVGDTIIHPGYFGTGTPLTTFDITAMTNVLIDCTNEFSIGKNSSNTMGYNTKVRLCRGRVLCKNLIVATSPVGGAWVWLELNSTVFTVSNSATLGDKAFMTNNVAGYSGGLDLPSNATLSVTSPGKLQINFRTNQAPDETGIYWGLKWAGDHRGELGAFNDAGQIMWSSTVPDKVAGIKYDAASNITYVALLEGAGPSVLTRNLNLEIAPPAFTSVTVAVDDVDAGSFDLGGVLITNRFITCPDDTILGDDYVTLDALGAHTVTLTVVNSNGVSASEVATVSILLADGGTTNSLTWDAGATLTAMWRPEWLWGLNWVGDVAPTNPTTGTLTFGTLGVGTNTLDTSRTIGSLVVQNQSGQHYFDLNGATLAIEGNIGVNPAAGNTTASLVFTNGTVRIGTPGMKRNVTIGSGSSFYYTGQMTVAPGTVFDANLATLLIGNGWGGRGYLDLRGAVISNRLLRATDIQLGALGQGSTPVRPCEIRIDESTALDELRADRYLDVCIGEHNTARIGNPANNWRFPTNLSLTVGSVGQRGRMYLGYGYWSGDGALSSATGGTFSAYLTDIRLGLASASYPSYGTIDFKTMSNCTLDVSGSVDVGFAASGSSSEGNAYGILNLPRGTALVKDLKVGIPIGYGRMELHGTLFTVTNSVLIGPYGSVSNFLNGTSAGLDLASTTSLTVSNGGKLAIIFQTKGPATGTGYWGLRWAGDHRSDLQTLRDAGKLISSGLSGVPPEIYLARGFTHFGYQDKGGVFLMR